LAGVAADTLAGNLVFFKVGCVHAFRDLTGGEFGKGRKNSSASAMWSRSLCVLSPFRLLCWLTLDSDHS